MLFIKEVDDNSFTRQITSNPTWQMINRICNNYGYEFDPYARVEIYKNGRRNLENISITSSNENFPDIECEDNNGRISFSISPKGSMTELTLDEFEDYTNMITGTLEMLNELSDVDFNDLYEYYLDE